MTGTRGRVIGHSWGIRYGGATGRLGWETFGGLAQPAPGLGKHGRHLGEFCSELVTDDGELIGSLLEGVTDAPPALPPDRTVVPCRPSGLDDTVTFQQLVRLRNRPAGEIEVCGQLTMGGELSTDLELTRDDQAGDLAADLLDDRQRCRGINPQDHSSARVANMSAKRPSAANAE